MANRVPEKLINFRVFLDGKDQIGVADVQLPSLEAMSETVKGAGIAGEVDSPVLGHFGSMTLTLNWRVVTGDLIQLAAQKSHSLDLRGSIQTYDAGTGSYKPMAMKVVVRAIPKTVDLGKLDVGATADSSTELEVSYMKVSLDGKDRIELDKFNFIYKVDGTDHLSEVRANLGL